MERDKIMRDSMASGWWLEPWRMTLPSVVVVAGVMLTAWTHPARGEEPAPAGSEVGGAAVESRPSETPAGDAKTATVDGHADGHEPEPSGDDEVFARSAASAVAMMEAFDAGNAEALAAMFAADGELIDEAGTVYSGRDEVAGLFTAFFEKFPGAMLAIEVIDSRPVGETLAIEEGLRQIVTPDGSAAQLQYTAIRARDGETWPIVSYREFADDPPLTPGEMLEPLEWLVGEWVDESPEGRTTISYDWSPDGNFLVGEYELSIEGRPVGTTAQRIGWDPVEGNIRSWTFDPDGGFSQGEWMPTDDGWLIRSEATMPDGATGVATVRIRVRDEDHFSVESSDRIIAGIPEPDFTLVIARKPPAPGLAGDAAADDAEDAATEDAAATEATPSSAAAPPADAPAARGGSTGAGNTGTSSQENASKNGN